MRTLRQMWADGDNAIGGWLSIPATLSAEVMARAGFDYVCVDTQHGAVEYQFAVELIRAIEHGGSIPIVRVPASQFSDENLVHEIAYEICLLRFTEFTNTNVRQ